jgi:hypothetical protein
MTVRNLEDVVAQHTRMRRRHRAIEVDAFPVRRDPGGGVTDEEWTTIINGQVRAIGDTVWLLGQPRDTSDGLLPERLWPKRLTAVFIVDFDEVIGIMQARPDGVVNYGAAGTRATATAIWPLQAAESGDAPA